MRHLLELHGVRVGVVPLLLLILVRDPLRVLRVRQVPVAIPREVSDLARHPDHVAGLEHRVRAVDLDIVVRVAGLPLRGPLHVAQRQLQPAIADQHLGVLAVDLVDEREVALARHERLGAVELLLARHERRARRRRVTPPGPRQPRALVLVPRAEIRQFSYAPASHAARPSRSRSRRRTASGSRSSRSRTAARARRSTACDPETRPCRAGARSAPPSPSRPRRLGAASYAAILSSTRLRRSTASFGCVTGE